MTTKQASRVIGCSISHIRYLIKTGKLKAKRVEDDRNQWGYRLIINRKEVERFAKLPEPAKGWKRGKSKS